MKKLISILLVCAMLITSLSIVMPISVFAAESGDCGADGDNLTWEIDGSTLIISGTGAMKDYGEDRGNPPWYRLNFTDIVVNEGVTSIGERAFFNSRPSSVTIPSTL